MQWSERSPSEQRGAVRGFLEEASGRAVPVNDSLPDELITVSEIEGIPKAFLQEWIYSPKGEDGYSGPALVRCWRTNGARQ
jgi:hypothetical protein